MWIALLVVLAGTATPAPAKSAATPTPAQEKIEVRLQKKIPEGTQLEVRGSFVVTVDFLEKQGAVEGNPPAITQLRVDVKRVPDKPALPPKLTTGLTIAEAVPAPPGSAMHPGAIAARLRGLGAAIPARAWVELYTETNGAIRIEGAALSSEVIADFMKALVADTHFKDLNLVTAERAPDGNSYRFTLTAAARTP